MLAVIYSANPFSFFIINLEVISQSIVSIKFGYTSVESRGISEIKTLKLSLCLLGAFIGQDRAKLSKGELAETSASWDS